MGTKFPFPSLWPLFHYCQILSSLRKFTWMPLMDPEPQKWQKVCFYERLKKNYLFKLYFFLYRGILAFCSNDVTNHTFGSGHPIQPLWSFASNRVSVFVFSMCAENSVLVVMAKLDWNFVFCCCCHIIECQDNFQLNGELLKMQKYPNLHGSTMFKSEMSQLYTNKLGENLELFLKLIWMDLSQFYISFCDTLFCIFFHQILGTNLYAQNKFHLDEK